LFRVLLMFTHYDALFKMFFKKITILPRGLILNNCWYRNNFFRNSVLDHEFNRGLTDDTNIAATPVF